VVERGGLENRCAGNPCTEGSNPSPSAVEPLELPAVRGRRDRIASPREAMTLLAALDGDRALWATAMYAGLRLGELMALDWKQVDVDRDLIHVRWSYDNKEAVRIAPKSRAGVRIVGARAGKARPARPLVAGPHDGKSAPRGGRAARCRCVDLAP
jgi:integrase